MGVARVAGRIGSMLVLAGMLSCTGCAYFENRGNDLLDVLDVGLTTSKQAHISVYGSFLNLVDIGYSDFDGTFLGLGHRQVGMFPARQHAVGLLLWGREQFGYKTFDAADPDSPPSWRVAPIGLIQGPIPPRNQILNCPKMLHLGWIGVSVNCKFYQVFDFILGWTTLDIAGDDTAGKPAVEEAAPPKPEETPTK